MDEQMALFDVPEIPNKPTDDDKQRRRWENGFQKWSNKMAQSNEDQPLGCCGWGSMCNYCEDNTYGRPCVRALNAMCRDRKIIIDYGNRNYEDVWDGRFDNA